MSSVKKTVREKIWLNMNLGYPGIVIEQDHHFVFLLKILDLLLLMRNTINLTNNKIKTYYECKRFCD